MAAERTPPPRRLGRGLDALLGSPPKGQTADSPLQEIALDHIRPNPFQPRRDFAQGELDELKESLRTSGLLQPITVRPDPSRSGFQLIAGERRWRAAQSLGWARIPAIVREVDDRTLLGLALVENLQRTDLNPLDEAQGYRRLMQEFGATQQSVAELVGKSRSTVANSIRILDLPTPVQAMIRSGELTPGQVRPLLTAGSAEDIVRLAREIRDRKLPARAVEARTAKPQRRRRGKPARRGDPSAKALEERLRRHFQTDVSVTTRRGGGGEIAIRFYSEDDLGGLLHRFGLRRDA